MAKQRPSLEAFAQASAPELKASAQASAEASPALAKPRTDRPHTTLYLDRATQRTIKEIALQYDRKVHDLYIEGINLMLAQYGKPPIAKS